MGRESLISHTVRMSLPSGKTSNTAHHEHTPIPPVHLLLQDLSIQKGKLAPEMQKEDVEQMLHDFR
jgi:hypothetical protein